MWPAGSRGGDPPAAKRRSLPDEKNPGLCSNSAISSSSRSVGSIVCYLTGLSHVDPVKAELFPGRFLNEEVAQVPDIDLDFPRDIREKLIPRVHERYGADRSALVAARRSAAPAVALDAGRLGFGDGSLHLTTGDDGDLVERDGVVTLPAVDGPTFSLWSL